jgi:pilus assembly protein TadC
MIDLDRKLQRKLEAEEEKNRLREKREENENKYVIAAILFLGTLVPLYLFWFLAGIVFNFFFGAAIGLLGVDIGWISPLIHGAIWISALVSVFKKRSVLETIVQRI